MVGPTNGLGRIRDGLWKPDRAEGAVRPDVEKTGTGGYAVALLSTRKLGLEHYFAVTAQCAAQRRQELFSFSDKLVAWLSSRQ